MTTENNNTVGTVLFKQIDEALEERAGNDRRKDHNAAQAYQGEDRRKEDRRKVETA